jgi:hypothetical protein
MKKAVLIFCIYYILHSTFCIFNCSAQSDTIIFQAEPVFVPKKQKNISSDTVRMKMHSPKKASWLALIPGAGQIYNKKYWKLPIVYAGLGATGYLIYRFSDSTAMYRKEYVARMTEDTLLNPHLSELNPKLSGISDESILMRRNNFRRNMEICVAACAIIYLLSIIDASVDAHLFYYDVSDNLSVSIRPQINYDIINRKSTPSLALVLKF